MNAEIITIGDEILIGQITDTNSKWMAEELNKIGVSVYQITSIQDNKLHILNALEEATLKVDVVLLTGGLGPTNDDITKDTLTSYFNDTLVLNKTVVAHIKKLFSKINYPFTEINKQQALLPTKCIPLANKLGTAPGMWFNENNKIIVSMPGVPNEMKGIMTLEVLPKLQKTFTLPYIIHKTVMTYGMGESMVAERIKNWEENLPKHISLAYLPSYGALRLRLSAKGFDKEVLETSIKKNIASLYTIIGDIITGIGETETIEKIIGELLKKGNFTIATAESCTGGAVAQKITSIAGASSYFIGSIVSYATHIKVQELQVAKQTIKKHSVVSEAVAKEMAIGIQQKFNTSFSIAITGNAGPTTAKTAKTVGDVFIAIATPNGIMVKEFNFGQPRKKVIERATNKSLELLKKEIIKNS